MATKKATGGHVPLDPKTADKLLDLLGSDNEFRRLFKKDATAALAKVGYAPAQQTLAARAQNPASPADEFVKVGRIAPKAEIAAARAQLRDYLLAPFTFNRCDSTFDSGNVAPTLRRK